MEQNGGGDGAADAIVLVITVFITVLVAAVCVQPAKRFLCDTAGDVPTSWRSQLSPLPCPYTARSSRHSGLDRLNL